jgi:tetratricopeptide (TPR) repeat protein
MLDDLFLAAWLFPDLLSLVDDLIPIGPFGDQWITREPPEFQAAHAQATAAIEANPADKDAFFLRGLACKSRGHFAEAFADFCEVLRLDPDHAKAWLMLSEVLVSLGRYDVAKTAREQALQRDPTLA